MSNEERYRVMLERRAAMWAKGLSIKAMARREGVTRYAMSKFTETHRESFPYRYAPRVTLDSEEVMRRMKAEGMTYKEIARQMGTSVATVVNHIGPKREAMA